MDARWWYQCGDTVDQLQWREYQFSLSCTNSSDRLAVLFGAAATHLVSRYAFTTLGLSEIQAEVLQRNPASIRLLEKTGFQLLRVNPATAAEPEELLLYALARRASSAA